MSTATEDDIISSHRAKPKRGTSLLQPRTCLKLEKARQRAIADFDKAL